jgi:beta-glucosidase
VTLLVLGGSSSRFGQAQFDKNGAVITDQAKMAKMDCGEGVDLSSLKLPKEQLALAQAVYRAARKTVTVVIAGRPYDLQGIMSETDALMYAFYPGPEGGRALAGLLFGEVSPSGRLPVSIPRGAERLPAYYNYRNSYDAMHYCDGEDGPLFSFGYGLGYGDAKYSDFKLQPDGACEGDMVLEFDMENDEECAVWGVPMVFVSRFEGSVIPRAKELAAFDKRRLAPGERVRVQIRVEKEAFFGWNREMKYKADSGRARIMLRDGKKDLWSGDIELG